MTGFIISGTDTDVGKTVFAAALVAAIGARYWKPIQAGLTGESDLQLVQRLSGSGSGQMLPEVYRLTTPASPHSAADIDGIEIDLKQLVLPDVGALPLVVEGAGGVLVPLTHTILQVDLFASWKLPVILVSSTRLGTINHSLLSIEALKRRAIPVHGIAFVGDANASSERAICDFGQVRALGRLPWLDDLTPASLKAAFQANFKREDFA